MKKLIGLTLIIGMVIGCAEKTANVASNTGGPIELKSFEDSLNYSYGVQIAQSLKSSRLEINPEIMAAAITDALKKEEKLSVEQCQLVIRTAGAKESELALEAEQKFFDENGEKEGIKTLESGLQYRVINRGSGISPKATDMVTTHYTGKLLDGTVFDSSVEKGQPAQFAVNRVIRGWTEALQLMKEGSKWELFIPSSLGYGPRGTRGIPPNATLVFEVELISVDSQ